MSTSGRLAAYQVVPGTETVLYTVPPGAGITKNFTVLSINCCNRGSQAGAVSIALLDPLDTAANTKDWIEFNTEILSHGVLERTSIMLTEGQSVSVLGTDANISVTVFGIFTGVDATP